MSKFLSTLREEGDQDTETGEIYKGDFYPRSARRATGLGDQWFQNHQISIHALREEATESNRSSRG